MSRPLPPKAPPRDQLVVRGARVNNLADVTVGLPHDKVTAVTGVSGSGKSSLAFDTLFAEGQWRYLESLPAYARTLMEKAVRPEVDGIDNVRPAIALEQRTTVRTARSTLGTLTELADHLRALFAGVGRRHCPQCGAPVTRQTPTTIAAALVDAPPPAPWTLEAPVAEVLDRLEPSESPWGARLMAAGFGRVRWKGELLRLDDADPAAFATAPEPGDRVVVERLGGDAGEERILRGVEEVTILTGGVVVARGADGAEAFFYTDRKCGRCRAPQPELRPAHFNFNSPLGACPTCTGFGAELVWDAEKIIPDPEKTLRQGAVEVWQSPANRWWQEELLAHGPAEGVELDIPWAKLPEPARAKVWRGTRGFEGIDDFFAYLETKRYKMHVRVFLARYRRAETCATCGGARLRPGPLGVTVHGENLHALATMPVDALHRWVRTLPAEVRRPAPELFWRLEARLATLTRLGLGYLTLNRASRTLSGGEMQRAALSRQLSNHLTHTLYVLDEPSIGLHPRDVTMLSGVLHELAGRGNTVCFVEHDLEMVATADHVVELGPGGGRDGGRVVYAGNIAGLLASDTATGRAARHAAEPVTAAARAPKGWLRFEGCTGNNLRGLDVSIPLGVLTVITGVSGSGKSTLLREVIEPGARTHGVYGGAAALTLEGNSSMPAAVRVVDQEPMGRTSRSIPLTYLDAYTPLRKAFAAEPMSRRLGLTAAHFSFNTAKGRCPVCEGTGRETIEMLFFEDVEVPCPECGGRRFRPEVLAVRCRGATIDEVMRMSAAEALERYGDLPGVAKPLALMARMGLGYLVLGQAAPTLSGGEAQRLKICAELAGKKPKGTLYLMDEPTTGMHAEDVEKLLALLGELVAAGNSVVVVEHNLAFMARADWMLDLGPEGGEEGGRLVDAGPPAEVAARKHGPTGAWLANFLRERQTR